MVVPGSAGPGVPARSAGLELTRLLDPVPAVAADPRARRGVAGDLRRSRRVEGVGPQVLHRGVVATLPGVHYARNLLATVPQVPCRVRRRRVPVDLRVGHRRPRSRPASTRSPTPRRAVPQGRRVDAFGAHRRAGVRGVPAGALAQGLVEQPARAAQQGSETPLERRRHIRQRPGRDPLDRCRSPANTTNGLSPAATSRRDRWPSSPPSATLTTNSRPSPLNTPRSPAKPHHLAGFNPWINEM